MFASVTLRQEIPIGWTLGGGDGEGGEDDGRALGDGVELEEAGPPNLAAEPARQVFRACWDPREALGQPIILPASK